MAGKTPAKKTSAKKKVKASGPSFFKQNKLRLALTGLAVVLAAAVVFISESSKPLDDAQLLRRAIVHSISKQTATLTYEFQGEFGSALAVADVDYTDISGVVANVRETGSFAAGFDEQKSYEVELVADVDRIYAQLVRGDSLGEELPNVDWDTWYYIDRPVRDSNLSSALAFSHNHEQSLLLSAMLNSEGIATTHGEIPDGNFSQEQQAKLVAVIDERVPYVIQAAETEEIEGRDYRKLELLIKGRGIDAVNDVVSEITGQDVDLDEPFSRNSTVSLFIDIENESLHKVVAGEQGLTVTVTYTNYDQPIDLGTPDTAFDLLQILEDLSGHESELPAAEAQLL